MQRALDHRIIQPPVLCTTLSKNPWPKSRLRGSRAAGIRFEKAVAKAIAKRHSKAQAGLWFEFQDQAGRGMCSPDLVLLAKSLGFVFECKLSYTPMAESQLSELYIPVLEHHFQIPFRGIVVARHLNGETPIGRVAPSLAQALQRSAEMPILHWLGKGRI